MSFSGEYRAGETNLRGIRGIVVAESYKSQKVVANEANLKKIDKSTMT
jgi:hypothetical protein